MLTYDEAREMMKRAKCGRRKLENNTWLEVRDCAVCLANYGATKGEMSHLHRPATECAECSAPHEHHDYRPDYAIRLHETDVVTLHPDGSYTLNSGGWRTVTTKDRINRYAPGMLASDRGSWYYYPLPGNWTHRFPFADGLTVTAGRQVRGAGLDESVIRRELQRQVRAYIDGFAAHVAENGLADPGPGDCWGCHMVRVDGPDKPEGPMGISHIFEHMKEGYYVPSLVWRSVQHRGDPGLVYHMMQRQAQQGKVDWLVDDLRRYFRKLMSVMVAARVAEAAEPAVEAGVSHVA